MYQCALTHLIIFLTTGWVYAHHFSDLELPRDGGRKKKQKYDCVRSRCWVRQRRKHDAFIPPPTAPLLFDSGVVATSTSQGLAVDTQPIKLHEHKLQLLTERLHRTFLELGLKETRLAVEETDVMSSTTRCPIYLSSNWRTCRKLIMFFQGAGGARPGMWSRTLCVDEGLHVGSMLPFVEKALGKGYGVIIFNPFSNHVLQTGVGGIPGGTRLVPVVGCETPQNHVLTVWDTYVSQVKSCDLIIIANGYGCELAMYLLEQRSLGVVPRVHAIAFAESSYRVERETSDALKACLKQRAVNWKHREHGSSTKNLMNDSSTNDDVGCITLYTDLSKKWDGNVSRTIAASLVPIFKWLDHASAVETADSNKWANSEGSRTASSLITPLLSDSAAALSEDVFDDEFVHVGKVARRASIKRIVEQTFKDRADSDVVHFSECSTPGEILSEYCPYYAKCILTPLTAPYF